MSEMFWDEKFEWVENLPLSDEERQQLTIEQRLKRELVLGKYMAAYKGRWIIRKDQIILGSDQTLDGLLERGAKADTADALRRVPEKSIPHAFLAEAA